LGKRILETERLILRSLEPGDFEDLFELYRDPDMRRYFPEGVRSCEETREELMYFVHGGDPAHPQLGLWAAIQKPTGRFIGRCGLIPWTIDGRFEVEVAYMIAKPFWRQGLGSEAASALVKHGFEIFGLRRIIALIDPGNIASKLTAERAGLRFERLVETEAPPFAIYSVEKGGSAANPGEAG
jgi:[ribosomal protein S5]-alanine N-acetyltransferase